MQACSFIQLVFVEAVAAAAVGEVGAGEWAGRVRGFPEAACLRARACNPAVVTAGAL
jgi:hypothetical protein